MYKKIILVCGMPRSGTSWLGQVFDSSPDVAFRMEPLFSYQFKNIIDKNSSQNEIQDFFNQVYQTEDEFIHQRQNRKKGFYLTFQKNQDETFLVLKTTRHHHLLEPYLKKINNIHVVSIIRHPCAVISSWMDTEREFKAKGCIEKNDWRSGKCRKIDVGEFWGFQDWLSVTKQHVELYKKFNNFSIVKYSELIKYPENVIKKLFNKLSIPYTEQTEKFLKECHDDHHEDPYSVYKNKDVENKWKIKLNNNIAQEIIKETKLLELEEFLE